MKRYLVETSYQNSMGGITQTTHVVDAGINDNIILAHIANLIRKDDPSLDFRVSRAGELA